MPNSKVKLTAPSGNAYTYDYGDFMSHKDIIMKNNPDATFEMYDSGGNAVDVKAADVSSYEGNGYGFSTYGATYNSKVSHRKAEKAKADAVKTETETTPTAEEDAKSLSALAMRLVGGNKPKKQPGYGEAPVSAPAQVVEQPKSAEVVEQPTQTATPQASVQQNSAFTPEEDAKIRQQLFENQLTMSNAKASRQRLEAELERTKNNISREAVNGRSYQDMQTAGNFFATDEQKKQAKENIDRADWSKSIAEDEANKYAKEVDKSVKKDVSEKISGLAKESTKETYSGFAPMGVQVGANKSDISLDELNSRIDAYDWDSIVKKNILNAEGTDYNASILNGAAKSGLKPEVYAERFVIKKLSSMLSKEIYNGFDAEAKKKYADRGWLTNMTYRIQDNIASLANLATAGRLLSGNLEYQYMKEALDNYDNSLSWYDPRYMTNVAGGMIFDPTTYIGGWIGGKAIQGAGKLLNTRVGTALVEKTGMALSKLPGTTLAGKVITASAPKVGQMLSMNPEGSAAVENWMLANLTKPQWYATQIAKGTIGGAANLGTFSGIHAAESEALMLGNDTSGGDILNAFVFGADNGKGGREGGFLSGAFTGAGLGVISPFMKRMQMNASSFGGKLGSHMLGIGIEATAFSGLNWVDAKIRGNELNFVDDLGKSLGMVIGLKFQHPAHIIGSIKDTFFGNGLSTMDRVSPMRLSADEKKFIKDYLGDNNPLWFISDKNGYEAIRKAVESGDYTAIEGMQDALSRILSDKEGVPFTMRNKIAMGVLGVAQPSMPIYSKHNIDDINKKVYLRSANGELIDVKEYKDIDELSNIIYRSRIIAKQQHLNNAISQISIKNAEDTEMQDELNAVFDKVCADYGLEFADVANLLFKDPLKMKPVEQQAFIQLRDEVSAIYERKNSQVRSFEPEVATESGREAADAELEREEVQPTPDNVVVDPNSGQQTLVPAQSEVARQMEEDRAQKRTTAQSAAKKAMDILNAKDLLGGIAGGRGNFSFRDGEEKKNGIIGWFKNLFNRDAERNASRDEAYAYDSLGNKQFSAENKLGYNFADIDKWLNRGIINEYEAEDLRNAIYALNDYYNADTKYYAYIDRKEEHFHELADAQTAMQFHKDGGRVTIEDVKHPGEVFYLRDGEVDYENGTISSDTGVVYVTNADGRVTNKNVDEVKIVNVEPESVVKTPIIEAEEQRWLQKINPEEEPIGVPVVPIDPIATENVATPMDEKPIVVDNGHAEELARQEQAGYDWQFETETRNKNDKSYVQGRIETLNEYINEVEEDTKRAYIKGRIRALEDYLKTLEEPENDTRDVNAIIDAARNGDADAQAQLTSYGINWGTAGVYRFVSEGEVDSILEGNRYNGRFNGNVDVTASQEMTTAANGDYRITFKPEHDLYKMEGEDGNRARMKNADLKDGYIRDGYSLDDVAKIEKKNEDGTYTEVYSIENGVNPEYKKAKEPEVEVPENVANKEAFVENRNKYQGSRVEGNRAVYYTPDGKKLKAVYVLGDARNVVTSHDPHSFEQKEGIPTREDGSTLNDNDYRNNKQAQQTVRTMSNDYNGKALQNMPVVDENGIALSGNNRMMSRVLAGEKGTDKSYIEDLYDLAEQYGFTKEQIDEKIAKGEIPEIHMELTEKLPYTTETYAMFNKSDMKKRNPIEEAVVQSKVMRENEKLTSRITSIIENIENLSDLYKDAENCKQLVQFLVDGNVITKEESGEWFNDNGTLSEIGKAKFENIMTGIVLDENTIRLLNNPDYALGNIRQNIAYSIVEMIKNQRLGEYAIVTDFNKGIELYGRAKAAGNNTIGDIILWATQEDMFSKKAPIDDYTMGELFASMAVSLGQKKLKAFMREYNNSARESSAGQTDMFNEGKVLSKEQIIESLLKDLGYDTTKIRERINRVTKGEPDVPVIEEGAAGGEGRADDEPGEESAEVEPYSWLDEYRSPNTGIVRLPEDKQQEIANKFIDEYKSLHNGRIDGVTAEMQRKMNLGYNLANKLRMEYEHPTDKVGADAQGDGVGTQEDYAERIAKAMITDEDIVDALGGDEMLDAVKDAIAKAKKGEQLGQIEEGLLKAVLYASENSEAETAKPENKASSQVDKNDEIYSGDTVLYKGEERKVKGFNGNDVIFVDGKSVPLSQVKKISKNSERASSEVTREKLKADVEEAKNEVMSALMDFFKPNKGNNTYAMLVPANPEQAKNFVRVVSAVGKFGYRVIKLGAYDFKTWAERVKSEMSDFFKSKLGWDDKNIDDFTKEMWDLKFKLGDETHTIREWAEAEKSKLTGNSEEFVVKEGNKEAFKNNVKRILNMAISGEGERIKSIVELRKMAKELGLEGIKDTDIQEIVETAIVEMARDIAKNEWEDSPEVVFDKIKALYENQPSLNQRDTDRIMLQQYSTPAPMAYLLDMFVDPERKAKSGLEPSAGNGMLTIGLDASIMHVNDIDEMRLSNLRTQGFGKVTNQDGTQPFGEKAYDVVVTNPPFGSTTPRDYDGYSISGLEHQMAINALMSMKDNGKAAIIVGGNMEYQPNGAIKGARDKAFYNYLYSHYNVVDVINLDGKKLYSRQGTGYDVRMILIDGRKEFDKNSFAPVEKKARAEKITNYEELFNRVSDDLRNSNKSASVRNEESGEGNRGDDRTDVANTPKEGVRNVRTTGSSEQPKPVADGGHELPKPVGGRSVDSTTEMVEGGNAKGEGNEGMGEQPIADNGGRNESPKTSGSANGEGRQGSTGVSQRGDNTERNTGVTDQSNGMGQRGTNDAQRNDEPVQRKLGAEKVPYRKQSGNPFSLNSLMPAEQADQVKKVLEEIGDVDAFVSTELGYSSVDEMYSALAAEQIDSVAMAIHQMNQGNAFIIGDQTGIGKGRQAASLIRYGVKKGGCPVFVTVKKALFSDMYRDLCDIGSPELRPFIWTADDKDHSANVTDNEGNTVYEIPSKKEQERVVEYINKNGKLPPEYDYVLTTYDSFKSGTKDYENGEKKDRKFGKKQNPNNTVYLNGQKKRDAFEALASNSYVIMDESHNAGGEGSNVSNYLQYITTKSKGTTFLSATFAKRPGNMPIYSLRTAISKANVKVNELIDAVKKGGATFQEVMSKALTEAGQMIRRERDMTGVTIDWKGIEDEEIIQKQREQYDTIIGLFNQIIDFQRTYVDPIVDKLNDDAADMQGEVDHTPGTRDMGINNTPFASRTYNMVQQVLLSLKAEESAKRAIEHLKQGRKPVIAVANTNEGAAGEASSMGEDMEMPDLSVNLRKGLEGVMRITKKDASGESVASSISLNELSEEGRARYGEIITNIENASSGLSLSPIDVIKNELKKAGYSVGELTGRTAEFVYNEDGTVRRVKRTDTDKKKVAAMFNNGELDALILNRSAGTGISLHASSKFKDQRQRIMIVAQAQGDVNDEVQIRGRIDRTGQILRGMYEYVVSNIPSEQRLLMMLKSKLRSLDANTTSSQKSKFNEMDVQDVMNKYGDNVLIQYLAEHPETYSKLADPLKWGDSVYDMDPEALVSSASKAEGDGATASKILGRMALLTVREQEAMLDDITQLYTAEIERLNDMGENDLEITEMPLKAKTIKKSVWESGSEPDSGNPFADNTYIEEVEMDVLKKPMKASEIKATQDRFLEGKTYEEYKEEKKTQLDAWEKEKTEKLTQEFEERAKKHAEADKAKALKAALKDKEKSGMTDEECEKAAQAKYDETHKSVMDKLQAQLSNLKAQRRAFDVALDSFNTNEVVSLPSDIYNLDYIGFNQYFGKLIDIKISNNFSTSASTITFAALDGRRKITIPISGMVKNKTGVRSNVISWMVNKTEHVKGGVMGENAKNQMRALNMSAENWDKLSSNAARKKGYIVTGNLLQALVTTSKNFTSGKLISYTTDTGEVRQGLLMSDQFDPKKVTGGTQISDAFENIKSWDKVTSADGEVSLENVTNWRGTQYELRVPKSVKRGGKYFMDKELLDLVEDKEFTTSGSNMTALIRSDEDLKKVLDILSKKHGVKVMTDADGGIITNPKKSGSYSFRDGEDEFPYGSSERDYGDHYSHSLPSDFDADALPDIKLDKNEFNTVIHSIDAYHKKDKNFSLNTAYSAKNGYLYIRKGNNIKFVGSFDLNEKPIVEHDLKQFVENGSIRDRRSIGEFISKYSHSKGMDGESVSDAQRRRGGNVQSDKMDIRQGANVRTDGERVVSGLPEEETKKLDEEYVNAVNNGDGVTVDRILSDEFNRTHPDTKVVDENGKPILVHHGTNAKFNVFDIDKAFEATKMFINGAFFTPAQHVAKAFADVRVKLHGGEQRIVNAYLNMTKPYEISAMDFVKCSFDDAHRENVLNEIKNGGFDGIIVDYDTRTDKGLLEIGAKLRSKFPEINDAENYLKEQGYSSKERWDIMAGWMNPDFSDKQYAVFKPEQIKSADVEYNDTNELILPSERNKDYNPDIRYRSGDGWIDLSEHSAMRNGTQGVGVMREHAEKVVAEFNAAGGKCSVVGVFDELDASGREALRQNPKAKGWTNNRTGEVVIYLPNNKSKYDVEQTILHERVGHEGIRGLLGQENYMKFMRRVFAEADPAMRKWVLERAQRNGMNLYKAMEEYMSIKAEDMATPSSFFAKVGKALMDFVRNAGYKMFGIKPAQRDIRELLWLSANRMRKGNTMDTMRYHRLMERINNLKEPVGDDARAFAESGKTIEEWYGDIDYSSGIGGGTPAGYSERVAYHQFLSSKKFIHMEAHYDYMQSAKEAVRAIVGKKELPNNEDFISVENQLSSRNMTEQRYLLNDIVKPLEKVMKKILPNMETITIGDRKLSKLDVFERNYVYALSGLERNRVFNVEKKGVKKVAQYDKKIAEMEMEVQSLEDQMRATGNTALQTDIDKLNLKIDTAKQDKDALQTMIDGFRAERSSLYHDLINGRIDLREYFQKLDDYIKTGLPKFDINKSDMAGLCATDMFGDGKEYEDADVIDMVMDIESKIGEKNVRAFWKSMNELTSSPLYKEFDSGIHGLKAHEKARDMFNFYVPLRGFSEETAEDAWGYMNEVPKLSGGVLMNAKGRKSGAEHPIATAIAMANHAIIKGNRNIMLNYFKRFVENNKSDLFTELGEIWYRKDPVTDEYVAEYPNITPDMDGYEVADAIDIFNAKMAQAVANGEDVVKMSDMKGDIPLRFENKKDRNQHIVTVKTNGKMHAIIVNGNPRVAQALNGLLNDSWGDGFAGKAQRAFKYPLNKMQQLMTTYSLTFSMRNAFRDFEFATTYLGATEGLKYAAKFIANYTALGTNLAGSSYKGERSAEGMLRLFHKWKNGTLDMNSRVDRYFNEFVDNGGMTGFVQLKDIDAYAKELERFNKKVTRSKAGKIVIDHMAGLKDIVGAYTGAVSTINEAIENHARFATYITSRNEGRGIVRSVKDAKNVSVNFNRRGSGASALSFKQDGVSKASVGTATLSSTLAREFLPFYNAAVQGAGNFAKALKANPIFTSGFGAVLGGIGYMICQWNKAIAQNDNDEDRKKFGDDPYSQLPEYERRQNLCLYTGHGNWVKIPLAIEWRAFYAMGDVVAGHTSNPNLRGATFTKPEDDAKKYTDMVMELLVEASQITPMDMGGSKVMYNDWKGALVGRVTPGVIAPIAAVAFNMNWMGTPIWKKSYGTNDHEEMWRKANSGTPKWMVDASEKLTHITTNDMDTKGILGDANNPAAMYYLIQQYFGGPAKESMQVATAVRDLLDNGWDISKTDAGKLPVTSAFFRSKTVDNTTRNIQSRFYAYQDEAMETKQRMKTLEERKERGDFEAGVTIDKMKSTGKGEEKYTFPYRRMKLMKDYYGRVDKLRKKMNKTADKDERDIIQQKINETMRECISVIDAME